MPDKGNGKSKGKASKGKDPPKQYFLLQSPRPSPRERSRGQDSESDSLERERITERSHPAGAHPDVQSPSTRPSPRGHGIHAAKSFFKDRRHVDAAICRDRSIRRNRRHRTQPSGQCFVRLLGLLPLLVKVIAFARMSVIGVMILICLTSLL